MRIPSSILAASLILVGLRAAPLDAQTSTEDRRRFIRPETTVTDDPRRVVMPPIPMGASMRYRPT